MDRIFASTIRSGVVTTVWLLVTASLIARADTAALAEPSTVEQSRDSTRAAKVLERDFSKTFEELTPGERIAIRAAAKTAYRKKHLENLVVCADPGNMPFSNRKREGFENKVAQVLGEATGAQVSYYWRPSYERGITRETISTHMCDAMISIPTGYANLLTTEPLYRSTYVLAYRNDSGIDINGFDDPDLKKLRIGVFQTSAIRRVLAQHGIFENVSVHVVSHDADINEKSQPWYQVQQVVDGELDIAAVWGPFAGWLKAKGAPITLQPVNLWEDITPLEYEQLSRLQSARAVVATAGQWAAITAAVALCATFWHPVLYVLTVLVIGSRQHGLLILGHDASHFRTLTVRWQNDFFANIFMM